MTSCGNMTTNNLLAGKRVLVTGGSGGVGQGICAVAAREGASVAFVWSGNREGAARTSSMIKEHTEHCLDIQTDLREADAARRVIETMEDSWGGIDGLVNNAGVSEAIPFILMDDAEFAGVLDVNLGAAFRLCRAAARPMIRQKFGRIVNISSIAGSRAVPGPAHYAASKAGLDGLTRSLAHEIGPHGILVNAVAAGIFEGGLKATIPAHHQERYLAACALGRFGEPAECGEFVAWLLSDRNTYMNGSVVILDGGTLA